MAKSLRTNCCRPGLAAAAIVVGMTLAVSGIAVLPDSAHAAKPGSCEPWPECKNNDDGNGQPILLGTLHFEPNNGLDGAGLLTDHASDIPGPPGSALDYSGRIDSPGCGATPADEWFIKAEREIADGTQIWTANGSDLIIDVVTDGQFDGCHGVTLFSNGQLTLSLKKTGKGRVKTCSASLDWQFDYDATANQSLEFFTLQSIGWIPLTISPFDECDPKNLSSVEILGDFNFFSNVVENGVTTSSYLDTATLDFFVVFHTCPDGPGC